MDISVNVFPGVKTIIALIVALAIIGVGVYLLSLLITALKVYIKKNS